MAKMTDNIDNIVFRRSETPKDNHFCSICESLICNSDRSHQKTGVVIQQPFVTQPRPQQGEPHGSTVSQAQHLRAAAFAVDI